MWRTTKPWALLALPLMLIGCGSGHVTHSVKAAPPVAPFVCHHKVPAELGECIKQELKSKGIAPPKPLFGATSQANTAQCIDISRWQPFPNFSLLKREGIQCVIVQTNDGMRAINPFFRSQVLGAHAAHMAVGIYLFIEDQCGECQAQVANNVAGPLKKYITLGAWPDTEVPGAYRHACTVVNTLRFNFPIVGVYASPDNYSGGRCQGYIWPAEWGSGAPYPLPSYPYSAIKFRQWCGTCYLVGVGEIDRDEDRGLLALATPPPPPLTPAQKKAKARRELRGHQLVKNGLESRIRVLRRVLLSYGCVQRRDAHEHLGVRCTRWFHEGHAKHQHVKYENKKIAELKRRI